MKHHNPENLVFQHLPEKEMIKNPYKDKRYEEIQRKKNGIIIDTLSSVEIVEIVKCGGVILEVFEGFSVITWNIILIQNLLLICSKKNLNHKKEISFKT